MQLLPGCMKPAGTLNSAAGSHPPGKSPHGALSRVSFIGEIGIDSIVTIINFKS